MTSELTVKVPLSRLARSTSIDSTISPTGDAQRPEENSVRRFSTFDIIDRSVSSHGLLPRTVQQRRRSAVTHGNINLTRSLACVMQRVDAIHKYQQETKKEEEENKVPGYFVIMSEQLNNKLDKITAKLHDFTVQLEQVHEHLKSTEEYDDDDDDEDDDYEDEYADESEKEEKEIEEEKEDADHAKTEYNIGIQAIAIGIVSISVIATAFVKCRKK